MVSYIKVEIPDLYPYVLLVTGAIAFECLIFGFIAGSKRRTIFAKEFMEQFNEAHQQELKSQITAGGYPDMGNGYYARMLSYRDWFEF